MRAIVSGSCGLVGYSTCKRLLDEGWEIHGFDNDSRKEFFGAEASTVPLRLKLSESARYVHHTVDISHCEELFGSFRRANGADLVVHCAAQPSHDWATTHIAKDFQINAVGTLAMLDCWRQYCPKSPFIHVSTSKVYGDNPNRLGVEEAESRYELPIIHPLWQGIPENFNVDQCLHSFFGVSKLSGDLLAQEYGRHFDMPVGIFRPGCITGGHHQGAELHGFLNYLMKCVHSGKTYNIYGYKGKQVRCNIHSDDLVNAFMLFAANPRPGSVYNMGGRPLDCSLLEAIEECQNRCGRAAVTEYVVIPRTGDHRWWISDTTKVKNELAWQPKRSLASIFDEIYDAVKHVHQ